MKKIRSVFVSLLRYVYPTLYQLEAGPTHLERVQSSHTNCKISDKANIVGPSQLNDVEFGDYSYISMNSAISYAKIGKFCSIGPNFFCGWGIHPTDGLSTSPAFYSVNRQAGITFSKENKIRERLPVEIGNDVFIGMNVTVLDGVKIGDGAIIGAGAIVSKDIPAFAIAVGSPITILRYRFDAETIDKLLKIKWWDFDEAKLQEVERYFFHIQEFIDKYSAS